MNTELFEHMKTLFCDHLDVSPENIKLTSTLIEDLGADSLDLVSLALVLEERFEIEIGERDLLSLRTVGDVLQYLGARTQIA
jgi:acyl carrier protein